MKSLPPRRLHGGPTQATVSNQAFGEGSKDPTFGAGSMDATSWAEPDLRGKREVGLQAYTQFCPCCKTFAVQSDCSISNVTLIHTLCTQHFDKCVGVLGHGVTENTIARKCCRGETISLGNIVARQHYPLGNNVAAREHCRTQIWGCQALVCHLVDW